MTTASPVRALLREVRGLAIGGLVVIAISYVAYILLVRVGLLELLGVTSDRVEITVGGSTQARYGVALASPSTIWSVPLGLTGAVAICALVYGIITATTSRVQIAAGLTRRLTLRENIWYLVAVALTLTGLLAVAMAPALIAEPAPALQTGSLHPLAVLLVVPFLAAAGAGIGHLIGLTFLRFPWYVGVLLCVVLLALPGALPSAPSVTSGAALLLGMSVAAAVALVSTLGSRALIGGLQLGA